MTDTNELRKLLAAATPLPWIVQKEDYFGSWSVTGTANDPVPGLWRTEPEAFDDGSAHGEYGPSCKEPTRDLIVAAVNALPALLDELDAARAEVAEAKRLDGVRLAQIASLQEIIRNDTTPAGVEVARFRSEVQRLRADMREAMELLRAHGHPPNWLNLGEAANWNTRYGRLLKKHKETNQ
jgi:hypothetical protein